MSYLSQIQRIMPSAIGSPPATSAPAIGTPPGGIPPPQAHIEPPPYDAAMDPGWKGLLDPADHEFRNVLNAMSPEERQVLLQRAQRFLQPQVPSTSRAPGTI